MSVPVPGVLGAGLARLGASPVLGALEPRVLLASPLAFLIGLSLGALGGGGSILAVPVLVYVAGQSARDATTTSLVVVGITALVGIVPHLRAGRVRLAAGVVFGVAGVGGSLLGSRLNAGADPEILLLAFSVVMLAAAVAMWRRAGRPASPSAAGVPDPPGRAGQDVPAADGPGGSVAAPPAPVVTRTPLTVGVAVRVVLAGTVVGLLTGFFGVGGGFVIVPALVFALGFTMPEAVGTSLLVIAINAAVALSSRLGSGGVPWDVVVPFTLVSMVGVVVGSIVAGRAKAANLERTFAVLLVAVALYTATRSVLDQWVLV